jgi:hypothetical protein
VTVAERMTLLLAGLLRRAAWVLPPARRPWARAIQAEAGQVPAGWRRLGWLSGGFWLVAREAGMGRRIAYWLGLGVVAAAAAWAVWLSWRTAPAVDPESATDRIRVLVGVSALVILPWLGRRGGVFGPAGSGITPRLVRVAGCAAVCLGGVTLVRTDRSAGSGGVLGSGAAGWPREIIGLALLAAAAAAPHVVRTLAPRAGAGAAWVPAGLAACLAFAFVPLQALVIAYVAGILAVTSRRSPLPGPALAASAIAGLAACLLMYVLLAAHVGADDAGRVILFFMLSVLVFTASGAAAGGAAAWLLPVAAGPQEPPARRARQGSLAGLTAGAAGGLLIPAFLPGLGIMMVAGPAAGAAGGALGAAIAAARPRRPLPGGSVAAGGLVPGP